MIVEVRRPSLILITTVVILRCCAFRPSSSRQRITSSTLRRDRHSRLRLSKNNKEKESTSNVKLFELEEAFEDDGKNVVGTKFFGGSAVKEELYIPEAEERALELQNVEQDTVKLEFSRFHDTNAFGDDTSKRVGQALQAAINQILYDESDDSFTSCWMEHLALIWETPFSKSKSSPLTQLAESKTFYNKLDVSILSANTIKSGEFNSIVEVRWDIGAVWPNPWEPRVLLTGTSKLTIQEDDDRLVLLKQVDELDGKDSKDVIGALLSQLAPRFWDVYHIGMTPPAEIDPRFDVPITSNGLATKTSGNKSIFSQYKLSYLPPRLMTEPSLLDTNGRTGRTAQALPNHGFTTAIQTMGRWRTKFVPVSPVEVAISKVGDRDASEVKWSIPVPPEFASRAVLPLPALEEIDEGDSDKGDDDENGLAIIKDNVVSKSSSRKLAAPPPNPPQSLKCNYTLRPCRLVATMPYAGNAQDEEVTQLRRQLYQEVVERDGFKPKLNPETNRPQFFFWLNDAKACFTRAGGLGMAVYEWRGKWNKSNEIGIELEL